MVIALTHQLIALAAAAGEEANYFGGWMLAFGANGLHGARSYRLTQAWGGADGSPYSGDIYKQATMASYVELTTQAPLIADRLVGRLLRSLGTRDL